MSAAEEVPALPFARASVLEIPALYDSLRGSQPVARVRTPAGDLAWLVTRHDDVRTLFASQRLGRSHPDPEHAPRFSASAILGGPTAEGETEREDHARMRIVFNRSFSFRRIEALRPRVQAIVDGLLDDLARMTPPVDLHEAFSFPVPVHVICEVLGVPYQDRDRFRRWSDGAVDMRDRGRAQDSLERLHRYMRDLIERKRGRPGQDVISDLVQADQLGDNQVVGIAAGLLFAGHETTVARIDYGTLLLLTHPEQRKRLEQDPSLVGRAVEEILRMSAPGEGVIPRYATTDVEVGGVTIRAGELVLLSLAAANRDGEAFDEPDRFDIGRAANPHVAFGHGYRFCLGASLARVELQCVFGTLFRRFPTLRLAVPLEDLRRRDQVLTGGLVELPVAW